MGQATRKELPEATIRGERIKVGDRADDVQKRLDPDSLWDPNRDKTYGYVATARYVDADSLYVVTFGPPRTGAGAYVITRILQVRTGG